MTFDEPSPPPIALVLPWYGLEAAGGAEIHARRLAESLQQAGLPLEVWTTCGQDAFSPRGQDVHPPGTSRVNGVLVRRFPQRRSGAPTFFQQRPALLAGLPQFPEREWALFDELQVESDTLYAHIWEQRERYLFVFMPYAYATTFWGAWLAPPERSYLIPCLHDEPYARYSTYAWLFRRVRRVLFNSTAAHDLAVRLYDLPPERDAVLWEGVDMHWRGDAGRFRRRYGLEAPFLLYVGRRDRGKRTPFLIHAFCEYKLRRGGPLRLVLAGQNPVERPAAFADEIVDLGYLDEPDKHDACAAAALFVQPSAVESFSIVLMEAWLQGTAALVNCNCEVLRRHVERCGGGLPFGDYYEFEAALDYLLARPDLRRDMGRWGRAYVRENFRWQDVVQHFVRAVYPPA
ncbi:MAG: glycosyltransferase family 4 protein [Chloroflexia bacterium]|nr:glycosyltransferase family 4 protein [Chloroflexia bacterium]